MRERAVAVRGNSAVGRARAERPFALGAPEAAVLEPAGWRPAVVAGPHDVEQHGRVVVDAVLARPRSQRSYQRSRKASRSMPASVVNSTSPATFESCPPWTQGPIDSRCGDFLAFESAS